MKFLYTVLALIFFCPVKAQILNAYAKVSSISGSSVLAVSNVNEANHTFTVGGKVIIMQMQDDVIGTNTTNVSTFGDIAAIVNAGNYEIRVIASRSPASGTPTTITLASVLGSTYTIGSNSSVQLITFRDLGSNYTTSANITGLAWDGNVGGIIAIEVTNTLTLEHRILADGIGFLGGAPSASADEPCDNSVYITSSNLKAFKGEGIYKNTSSNFTNGRGKIASGGGGGSQNNAGGGGGGNYTAGGGGGLGYQCSAGNSGLGQGGLALSPYISGSRIFMGGGGGGGQQNNNVGTAGGNGGGIILIKANTIGTSTTCSSSIRISANGITPANSGNDGSGGGGGAGSIIIQATTFSATATCPLTVSANGGTGGTVGNGTQHGGGGGGGQGVIIYSVAQPTVNITTQSLNGGGGGNDNSGSNLASSGGGINNSGIITGSFGVLPIELIAFSATPENGQVKLLWQTSTEKNNAYFTIERSANGTDFTRVGTVEGAGTSFSKRSYQLYDPRPLSGLSYYRLKQTDDNGTSKYFNTIAVNLDESFEFSVFPNPSDGKEPISITLLKNSSGNELELELITVAGIKLFSVTVPILDTNSLSLNLEPQQLEPGIYFLKVKSGYTIQVKKLVIQ